MWLRMPDVDIEVLFQIRVGCLSATKTVMHVRTRYAKYHSLVSVACWRQGKLDRFGLLQ
jgi:hypothetical protein